MELRGVRVHNLQGIDVQIPWGQWVAISGVSGSGKSSLAFDTLFAEGQRRYLESLSPRARQHLEQLPKPEADHIDPLPPALAVRQNAHSPSPRQTVGTATEISHYLRLLFAKVGQIICPTCQTVVRKHTPQELLTHIQTFPEGRKFLIAIPSAYPGDDNGKVAWREQWVQRGFTRAILDQSTINLQTDTLPDTTQGSKAHIIMDRLTVGKSAEERVLDSLELGFSIGEGQVVLLWDSGEQGSDTTALDGKPWSIERYSDRWNCETCGREFAEPEPRLFNRNSPLGACPACEGIGSISQFSLEQLVCEERECLDEGAIACFREPSFAAKEAEWLSAARLSGVRMEVPFANLNENEKYLLAEGDPQSGFVGLRKLFEDLLLQSSKPVMQTFLNRWLTKVPCPKCQGQRLNSEALAVRAGKLNIAEVSALSTHEFQVWLASLRQILSPSEQQLMAVVLTELQSRTEALLELGLDELAIGRPLSTISTGEAQRIALAATIGHHLVNSLYVFDEPSTGLHPADCHRITESLKRIQRAENTLVVVEHEEAFLSEADHLIDLGPGAGAEGGRVVFEGPPAEIQKAADSKTARYLSGQESVHRPFKPPQAKPWPNFTLKGINWFPFRDLSVEFPLNCLCVLTGVSGSGKSVLLEQVLFPAFQHTLGLPIPRSERERFDVLEGGEQVGEVVMLDQSPLAGHSRSNPATYLGAFDEIRKLFAETPDAKRLGFQVKDFSFISATGGRCPVCLGQGTVQVEMQFLADLEMVCPECHGTRYRSEILAVRYRGLHIGEVLDLTVSEALPFFRTQPKIRKRLQVLKDVGLDYLPLGQPTGSLSGGESQRLKLASFLKDSRRLPTLFLFDEPTAGLHPADVQTLLNCFDHLLAVGHSVIVAEHNLHLINVADWVIDLGRRESQVQILAEGPPEQIRAAPGSLTGQSLSRWISRKPMAERL